jgi:signal transduction histidine kinase
VDIRKVVGAPGRRGVALAAAVLTLGLSSGVAISAGLAAAERDAASASLELRTAGVRNALDNTFQRYADTLHDLVAAASVQPAPQLVQAIVGERLAGAHQVSVIGADYTVLAQHSVDGTTPAPPARLTPGRELARALEISRSAGRLVTSPAHVLPTDLILPPAHRQLAFELAAPMHRTAFGGWVVVSVRAGDLLAASLQAAGLTGVATTLTETSPDGVTHDVARWSTGGDPTGEARHVDVALAGHAWQVLVRSTDPVVASWPAPLALAAAALVSVVLAGIVLLAYGTRGRAIDVARRAVESQRAEIERAARAELAMRERQAELAGFAAAAGEKLHSPLHTIAGFTDLLLEDADEQSRGFLDRINGSTRRMLGVVDELLAYAATDSAALRLDPVDLETLTLDVAASLTITEGERPSIDVGDLPLVTADAMLLRQVVEHLIGNAATYVRHGSAGRITVRATETLDGWHRIEVADRGIGIPAEHRERIFAPFHRAPSAEGYPGTGLGLAVCRRIVELHGGEMGVEANPGGGSIFWFTVSATGLTLSPDDLSELAAA